MKRFLWLIPLIGFSLWTSLVWAAPLVEVTGINGAAVVVSGSSTSKQIIQGGSATDTPVYVQGTVTTGAATDVTSSDTIYEITLTDTATVDSSIVLPAKCTGFELWGQVSTTTIRWMLNSGTYAVMPPGTPYNTFDKGINTLYSGRLYLKDTTEAGAKVTVIVWTKP